MDFNESFKKTMANVKALIEKTNKLAVLVIIQHAEEDIFDPVVPAVRESISNIICFVALGSANECDNICCEAEGIIDEMVIDADIKRVNSRVIIESFAKQASKHGMGVSYFSDFDCWSQSAINYIFETEGKDIWCEKIVILGNNPLSNRIFDGFKNRGISVSNDISAPADILIGANIYQEATELNKIKGQHFRRIYDIGIHNFSSKFISSQLESGIECYRSDDRAGMAGVIISIMENKYLVHNNVGRVNIGGIGVVSGGVIGKDGDIVVDNAFNPKSIFGIAAGDGTFKRTPSTIDLQNLNKIKTLI